MTVKTITKIADKSKEKMRFIITETLLKLLLLSLSIFLSLGVCEVYLRVKGHSPGYIPIYADTMFRPVVQLEVSSNYFTDEEGVFKANPDGDWKTPYSINAEGFRSIPFDSFAGGTPTILLLGDSFVWGASAKPITNCFPDILTRNGYRVFNMGIPGTDTKQYAFLADKYTPKIKPDILVVVFYMGNDIHPFRPMLPHKNLLYDTNVGLLQAFDRNGRHMTAQEAYETYLATNEAHDYLDDDRRTLKAVIKRFLMKSAIGTYVWVRLSQIRSRLTTDYLSQLKPEDKSLKEVASPFVEPWPEERSKLVAEIRENLFKIKHTAESNGSQFLLFVIPVSPAIKNKENSIENNSAVFDKLNPLIPQGLTSSDYMKLPDGHFKNSGHQKFAQFMLRIFDELDL